MGQTFAGAVDPLIPQALRVARMVLGPGSGLAADAVQEALLRAFRAWPALPDKERDVWPWLRTIVVREARRMAARNGRMGPQPAEEPLPDPIDDLLAREERTEAARALAGLPAPYRTAAELRYVHGLSCAESAAVLGAPLGTVKWRLHEAHAMVRRELAREPGEDGRTIQAAAPAAVAVARAADVAPGLAACPGPWPPEAVPIPEGAALLFAVPSRVARGPALWVATDRGHQLCWPGHRASGTSIAAVRALAEGVAGGG